MIYDLSKIQLTLSEKNALQFGLGHHLLPRKIDEIAIKSQIDSQIRRVCKANKCLLNYNNKTKLRQATDSFILESKQVCNTRKNRAIHNTLQSLSKNSNIKCCKMDKGNGVVILDTEEYFSKLDVIINDATRFSKLSYDLEKSNSIQECEQAPWIAKENSIAYYVRTYIQQMVDRGTYYNLLPRGSQPGKLYGMAKSHKEKCPLRPVLAAINTPEYKLSKWIELQIKPLYSSKWSVSSTQSFVNDLNAITPYRDDICVSFDIKSLYTNVPLQEVIDDVTETIFDKNTESIFKAHIKTESTRKARMKKDVKEEKKKKLTKPAFKNMLKACSENIFLYNGEVYKQIDGLSMGSPLAPILANWFVAKVEDSLLDNPSVKQPKFYRRYVDDIFAVFETEKDRDVFYSLLNNMHKNLQFTMETVDTATNSLPFLDVNIRISNSNKFETKVYRKPTNTNVLLNYDAVAPKRWKEGLIKCLLTRAKRVSSSEELFEEEVLYLKDTFRANGYPRSFIENTIRRHLSETTTNGEKETITQDSQEENVQKQVYFVLPYTGRASEKLHKRVKNEMLQHNIALLAAYRTTKVGSYFSLKSRVPALFKANVLYKFQCPRDENIHYIGETERQLFRRIEEHAKKQDSAINEHIRQCIGCKAEKNIANSFDIFRNSTTADILSEEAICIKMFAPSLNIQMGPFRGARVPTDIF